MIIGTWVEQTFDSQTPETNLRTVHTFNHLEQRAIKCMGQGDDGSRIISDIGFQYTVTCKIISSEGYYSEGGVTKHLYREEQVLRFNDTTLRVKVILEIVNGNTIEPLVNEITYKKVSPANIHAKTIQNTWEMFQSSDTAITPFQITFQDDGTYIILFKNDEEVWEEKSDEAGMYYVFDTFLMTSFFNNPLFGTPEQKDVACWDISFSGEGEEMQWNAVVSENGMRIEKRFAFIVAKAEISEEE